MEEYKLSHEEYLNKLEREELIAEYIGLAVCFGLIVAIFTLVFFGI
jgi:hypothetical protein